MLRNLLSIALFLVPSLAHAHPGHGLLPGESPLHYLLEPVHTPALLIPMVLLAWWLKRRSATSPG